MSMFANLTRSHRGPSRRYVAGGTTVQRANMRELSGLVADGMAIAAAARQMGISKSYASVLLGRVKTELGWQAQ